MALFANLSPATLIEDALRNREGQLSDAGALVALTGKRTGRSPKDKYVVREANWENRIAWGNVNHPMTPEVFARLTNKIQAHLETKSIYQQDSFACADPAYRIKIRLHTEFAWHALFAQCLFIRPAREELQSFSPDWNIYAAPTLELNPAIDGVAGEVCVAISFESKTILIAGTQYAGEIKKSIFSILNGLLPMQGVFPMHCSANVGAEGDVALFFGLSGTGKTTLSADPNRSLIGDDEHGWSDQGVFNIEGGCYAKTIKLSPTGEPQIWNAIKFGSVLENVPLDPITRVPDFDSKKYTENTRCAYPIEMIPNRVPSGCGGHPKNIFFLTCDAFGVLPPISRLSPEQAMQHFLTGYTAKIAGTEAGVTEPQATFSACFGAPFLPLEPQLYGEMLRTRLQARKIPVWLVNTGWSGGGYGVGNRMSLAHTRSLLQAALEGSLNSVRFHTDPVFGLEIPDSCPGVPDNILNPSLTWSNPAAYTKAANRLAEMLANPTKFASEA
ncbi:phosphoenolpyruvate carboxykinase (ATP) [Telmatocola sphagniphila]|uniref:Phosphoenolpyruvate carboxykinase (ATP) n=1 Tax=Telmatocola sphagniphila TaxID=1123043 RepID=A0A8E6B7L3_9BACT|nr:phosphoenolpyruvate carboxykinase (ATP) [Telmatocola sphagniphila]QVL32837.1 phosphoenolpyruvate carboxykinase (ATP) [Telmatocola sphagniphila]